ncbi:MAG: ADP-ribosylglycohydrolase family protein [Ignavibacteria bacterium]|nr:ADP-ribosylglycohydrolase family protein [Ignavibacteria bacterium]
MKIEHSKIKSALLGIAVGDALGVPVEFNTRKTLSENPITEMIGFGTHNQTPGTWSDDSSLTFCLAESLCKGYDLQDIAHNFEKWMYENFWTPHGEVFDKGGTTEIAIQRLHQGIRPYHSGQDDINSNGNGSLMRTLPLAFYLFDKPIEERFRVVREVSSITHAHIRSVIACFIYVEYAIQLLKTRDKVSAYKQVKIHVPEFLKSYKIHSEEILLFKRILSVDINKFKEKEISSTGYVLHTLEASLWCLLKCNSFTETVLCAVNLGDDTDTTGAVAGGLAGILYGVEHIPSNWLELLARKDDIVKVSERLSEKLE